MRADLVKTRLSADETHRLKALTIDIPWQSKALLLTELELEETPGLRYLLDDLGKLVATPTELVTPSPRALSSGLIVSAVHTRVLHFSAIHFHKHCPAHHACMQDE